MYAFDADVNNAKASSGEALPRRRSSHTSCSPRLSLCFAIPSFPPPHATNTHTTTTAPHLQVFDVPRRADFSVDVPGVLAAAKKHNSKMLFLTAPNNPDGSVMTDADVKACLALPLLVVLDEAYVEFGRQPSRIGWVKEHENLVVLRTFSKRAGLAGLRIGYGAFPLSLIEFLWRAKQPYNVSVAAEVAACAALSNKAYLQKVKDALVSERERLFGVLKALPGIEPYPSEANFILCKVVGHDAAKVKDRLMREEGIMVRAEKTRCCARANGVACLLPTCWRCDCFPEAVMVRVFAVPVCALLQVRYYSKPAELAGCIRISVGRPEDTDAIEKALRKILKEV